MSDKDAARVSAGVARARQLVRRLGWIREADGWEVSLGRDAVAPRARTCAVCGSGGKRVRGPCLSPGLWGRPRPELNVVLCDRCYVRTWRRSLGLLAAGLMTGVGSMLAGKAIMLVWAWVPWGVFVLAACVGSVVAWGLASMVVQRTVGSGSRGSWQGVPVRVVGVDGDGWTLHVASRSVVVSLDPVLTEGPKRRFVRESDLVAPVVGGVIGVVLTATVVWFSWHPEVRIVNVRDFGMEVQVDGHEVAMVVGIPGEAPNAGVDVRVPEGRRVFRAVALDGRLVDETVGWAGRGRAQLYSPGADQRCFRVEQRAYGRAQQPRPAVIELPSDRSLHTLMVSIDAWFQPNPPSQRDLWFSGGVRRSVRVGACGSVGRPTKGESHQR